MAASDEDGDILNYHWIAEVGEFTDSTNQTQTKWKSPLDGSGKTFSIEIAVTDEQVEAVLDAIVNAARTDTVGDGKVWVTDIERVVRIRTNERGPEAV